MEASKGQRQSEPAAPVPGLASGSVAGAGGGAGSTGLKRRSWFLRQAQQWLLGVMVVSFLGLSILVKVNDLHRASFDLEQTGGLPSDLLNEELDDWDHIATRGLKGAEEQQQGGAGMAEAGAKGGGIAAGGKGGAAGVDAETAAGGMVEEEEEGGDGASKEGGVKRDPILEFSKKRKRRRRPVTSLEERAKKSIIKIAEDESCALPRASGPCRLPNKQRIHIIFVSAMWNREEHTKVETNNMLKSILYGTRCPLHIHFMVSGEPEVSSIHTMLLSVNAAYMVPVPSPLVEGTRASALQGVERQGYYNDTQSHGLHSRLLYSLHFIPAAWVLERAKGLQLYPLDHHAGIPGMSKFFLPELLWQVERALYLDVDMILAGDVQDLFNFAKDMERDKGLLFFMSNNHPEGHNRRRWLRPYCSCQMVLHLERMRKANMSKLFTSTLKGHKPRELAEYVSDGDQFLFMRVCKLVKGVCRILPRMWNVSGCSKPIPFLGLSSRGKEANGTCWRVVHFNCMGHTHKRRGRYQIPPEWEEAYQWTAGMTLADAIRRNRAVA